MTKQKGLQNLIKLETIILGLASNLNSVDTDEIKKVFNSYSKIPASARNIDKLRIELKKRYPILFDRELNANGKSISHVVQEKFKDKILKEHSKKLQFLTNLKAMKSYLSKSFDSAEKFKVKVYEHFTQPKNKISFRIKEAESVLQNIQWGNPYTLVDVIGIRIVPRDSGKLPEIIGEFEKLFEGKILFKFNIFSYTTDELIKRISKNSIYYRAFHYHLMVGEFFSEIQIRTKGVDQWANLNHDTMYKAKLKITKNQEEAIMEFGKITNIVDYFEILQG